jgi:hypothetical protein
MLNVAPPVGCMGCREGLRDLLNIVDRIMWIAKAASLFKSSVVGPAAKFWVGKQG